MPRILSITAQFLEDVLLAIVLLWSLGLLVYQPVCIIPVAVLAAVALAADLRRVPAAKARRSHMRRSRR